MKQIRMTVVKTIWIATTALIAIPSPTWAQTDAPAPPAKPQTTRTFYLKNGNDVNEANEIQTALRNMLDPSDRIYYVPSHNAIVLRATPEQMVLAPQLLSDLDRPRKSYRLTYTITETDQGKRIGTEHFDLIVVSGVRTTLKNGSKIPILTGSYDAGAKEEQTQFTYLDIGLNLDVTVDEAVDGVRLRTKIERSSIAEEPSVVGKEDPIVRQTVLEGASILMPGKPVILGSLDVAGTTRHLDVDVLMEPVK